MSFSPPGESPAVSGPAAYPIYGVGSFDIRCSTGDTNTNGCPFAQATSTMSAGQALAAQALTVSQSNVFVNPNYVTGDGTLGPMVVYGSAAGVGGGTALFEVWVLRGGAVLSSGISCSFTVTPPSLHSQHAAPVLRLLPFKTKTRSSEASQSTPQNSEMWCSSWGKAERNRIQPNNKGRLKSLVCCGRTAEECGWSWNLRKGIPGSTDSRGSAGLADYS